MRIVFLIAFLILGTLSKGQSSFRAFFHLSGPEKTWTLFHPFKAGRAWKITKEARQQVAAHLHDAELDTFVHGGKIDAFRHAWWMARLTQRIGHRAALKLGKAHERGNYRQFLKDRGEDGTIQDSTACEMDLRNNEMGALLARKHPKSPPDELAILIIDLIRSGNLTILKRNLQGQLTTCDGMIVGMLVSGTRPWALPYCLIRSDQTP